LLLKIKVKLYFLFTNLFERFKVLLDILNQGFWLGILDTISLEFLTYERYTRWDHYKDSDYNLSGLSFWEENIINEYFNDKKTILLGASGGGRELAYFAKKSYTVDAFECNRALLEYSKNFLKSFNVNIRISHSKPSEVPDDLKIYDAAIIGWSAYMHIVGKDKRVHFLKQFREHLKKGGPILLSFFTRNSKSRRHYWIYQLAKGIRKLLFIKDNISIGDSVLFH